MKFPKSLESVGWIFWGVLFVILVYPCIYLTDKLTYDMDTASGANRYMIGVFGAAVAAAVLTWLLNLLLERVVLWTRRPKKKKKGPKQAAARRKSKA